MPALDHYRRKLENKQGSNRIPLSQANQSRGADVLDISFLDARKADLNSKWMGKVEH